MFSAEEIDPECKNVLLEGVGTSLSAPNRSTCEGVISLVELTEALKTMNTSKALGSDGFSAEFFSKFWHLLGPLHLELINVCFRDGELAESMKGSITS